RGFPRARSRTGSAICQGNGPCPASGTAARPNRGRGAASGVPRRWRVRRAMAAIIRDLGRVDVLINNAGIIQVGPAQHMNNDDFVEAMAVHFWAPLYLMRAVIPQMKHQGHG